MPEDAKNSESMLNTLASCYNNMGNAYKSLKQRGKAEVPWLRSLL